MFDAIFLDREAVDYPATRAILARLPNVPVSVVEGPDEAFRRVEGASDPVSEGKRILSLAENRGRFVRPCPGTRNYHCCGYRIIHIGAFCTMDCAYCILQAYFHPAVLTFFVNHDELLSQLDRVLADKDPEARRMGTGEFTDSLIWEGLTNLNQRLVTRFGEQDHAILELKSKSVNIDGLLDLPHNRKTVMAFSVNTRAVMRENERGTSSLEARLKAAARCEKAGYPLAFHFDPMVIYPGCGEEYKAVVREIFRAVSPENVVYISLGAFRFMPELKNIIKKRFPASKIPFGEFIAGLDNKMRYFKPLRMALFSEVAEELRKTAPQVTGYFCMEDDAVWRAAFGFSPEERGGLPAMLDDAAKRVCGISGRT